MVVQHAATPLSTHCADGVSCDGDWAAPLCISRRVSILDCREAAVELQEQPRAFTRVVEELYAPPAGVGRKASVAVTTKLVFVGVALRGGGVAAVALREVARAAAVRRLPAVLARPPEDEIWP